MSYSASECVIVCIKVCVRACVRECVGICVGVCVSVCRSIHCFRHTRLTLRLSLVHKHTRDSHFLPPARSDTHTSPRHPGYDLMTVALSDELPSFFPYLPALPSSLTIPPTPRSHARGWMATSSTRAFAWLASCSSGWGCCPLRSGWLERLSYACANWPLPQSCYTSEQPHQVY